MLIAKANTAPLLTSLPEVRETRVAKCWLQEPLCVVPMGLVSPASGCKPSLPHEVSSKRSSPQPSSRSHQELECPRVTGLPRYKEVCLLGTTKKAVRSGWLQTVKPPSSGQYQSVVALPFTALGREWVAFQGCIVCCTVDAAGSFSGASKRGSSAPQGSGEVNGRFAGLGTIFLREVKAQRLDPWCKRRSELWDLGIILTVASRGTFLYSPQASCMVPDRSTSAPSDVTTAEPRAEVVNLSSTSTEGDKECAGHPHPCESHEARILGLYNEISKTFLREFISTPTATVVDPAISWLIRSDKVSRVVYVKMTKTKAKTPKLRVTFLCTPTRQLKKHHDDPMPYFPLYALPVNLGAEFFAAVLVLQHVENNFINELYERRQKYTGKCMRIANSSGLHREEDDPREEAKHRSTSSAAKKNVAGNKSLSGGRGPARRGVDTGSTRASRMVELGRGVDTDRTRDSRRVELARGVDTGRTRASRRVELGRGMDTERTRASRQELAGSRNVRGNKDGMLATHIAASRHDATLPPRDMRNVLQSRPGHNHIGNLLDKLISPSEIQDLITVLQGKRMYAERHVGVANDFREKRFVDEIIHDRNRNRLGSIFVRGVVPPGTEDRRQVLQPGRGQVLQPGRGQVRVYNNNDLRSFIDENRATHNNEGKDSFRESSRLPRDAETWVGARMRVSLRDDLSSGRNLYPPDVRGKLHSRNNEPEAFPLVKDSALFERGLGSKTNIRDERRKLFSDIQGMRSINADLRGSGPGRSFDDADLGRRKPRTDDIASGIKTDVRGVNIRAGGWKARDDIRNMESIRDSFSKFDAYLSNVKSSMDFQHSGKAKPEFNQFFPNAGPKSERRSLFPNSKPQVTGDIRGENPYRDDKPNYFGEGDKSSKAGWFAFNERRAEDGIADRNRTHVDGSERNRIVGESVRGRRIFGGPERTGASVGPVDRNRNVFVRAEDRKRQVFETEARNKQVFIEPNRNSLLFGGSEDRKKPLYDVEDRNRSVYGELENRKRQMYVSPDDRKRYGEPVDSKRLKYGELLDKRSVYEEPGDRKRSVYGGPEDGSGYMFRKTDSRNLPVTKRSRPVVEVGRNRPTVEEIERSRLMAGEREREKNDATKLYVGDKSLEKGLQAYWAVERDHEPAASHLTPSSSNRDWDKVQSSGGHSSAASWARSDRHTLRNSMAPSEACSLFIGNSHHHCQTSMLASVVHQTNQGEACRLACLLSGTYLPSHLLLILATRRSMVAGREEALVAGILRVVGAPLAVLGIPGLLKFSLAKDGAAGVYLLEVQRTACRSMIPCGPTRYHRFQEATSGLLNLGLETLSLTLGSRSSVSVRLDGILGEHPCLSLKGVEVMGCDTAEQQMLYTTDMR
ncbi:hypothetical protein PR048_004100 [Dryococelus australis]|uniref:Uncharacterized protein n=1 Tax=Dryococelus australis TaxID=614101 RepID=A0ABQ9I4J0_9NEOP|nr:hypothetical protein PR048_004100 [Dryococelus australis]